MMHPFFSLFFLSKIRWCIHYRASYKKWKKMQFFPCLMWLLQVFLGQGIETFSLSTRSWNWYTLLYTLLQPTRNKSFWTQIFSSGTLNINIMMRELLPFHFHNINWREYIVFSTGTWNAFALCSNTR